MPFMETIGFDASSQPGALTVKDLLGWPGAPTNLEWGDTAGRTWQPLERRGASPLGRDLLSRLEYRGAYVPV